MTNLLKRLKKLLTPTTTKTLLWVNARRLEVGLKPLTRLHKGKRSETWHCPIANSLDYGYEAAKNYPPVYAARVSPSTIAFNGRLFYTPSYVSRWVKDFDNGYYPEYEG